MRIMVLRRIEAMLKTVEILPINHALVTFFEFGLTMMTSLG